MHISLKHPSFISNSWFISDEHTHWPDLSMVDSNWVHTLFFLPQKSKKKHYKLNIIRRKKLIYLILNVIPNYCTLDVKNSKKKTN